MLETLHKQHVLKSFKCSTHIVLLMRKIPSAAAATAALFSGGGTTLFFSERTFFTCPPVVLPRLRRATVVVVVAELLTFVALLLSVWRLDDVSFGAVGAAAKLGDVGVVGALLDEIIVSRSVVRVQS